MVSNLDAEWGFVVEVINALITVEKNPDVRVSVEVSLEKNLFRSVTSDQFFVCLWSAVTDIVSCRGWRTEFWRLDCFLRRKYRNV